MVLFKEKDTSIFIDFKKYETNSALIYNLYVIIIFQFYSTMPKTCTSGYSSNLSNNKALG